MYLDTLLDILHQMKCYYSQLISVKRDFRLLPCNLKIVTINQYKLNTKFAPVPHTVVIDRTGLFVANVGAKLGYCCDATSTSAFPCLPLVSSQIGSYCYHYHYLILLNSLRSLLCYKECFETTILSCPQSIFVTGKR